jgi:hypothetical protein
MNRESEKPAAPQTNLVYYESIKIICFSLIFLFSLFGSKVFGGRKRPTEMSNATYGSIKPEPAGFQPFKVKDGGDVCAGWVGGWVGGGEREGENRGVGASHFDMIAMSHLNNAPVKFDAPIHGIGAISRSLLGKISYFTFMLILIHDVSGGLSSDVYVYMRKHIHTHAEQLGMGTGRQARLHPEGLHRALHPARYTYLRLFDIRWYVLDVVCVQRT